MYFIPSLSFIFLTKLPANGLANILAHTIPSNIEKTGEPTTGNTLPKNHEGRAIKKQTDMPGNNFIILSKPLIFLFSLILPTVIYSTTSFSAFL